MTDRVYRHVPTRSLRREYRSLIREAADLRRRGFPTLAPSRLATARDIADELDARPEVTPHARREAVLDGAIVAFLIASGASVACLAAAILVETLG